MKPLWSHKFSNSDDFGINDSGNVLNMLRYFIKHLLLIQAKCYYLFNNYCRNILISIINKVLDKNWQIDILLKCEMLTNHSYSFFSLFIFPNRCLCVIPFLSLSVFLFIRLFVYPSICLSVNPSFLLSLFSSFCVSV